MTALRSKNEAKEYTADARGVRIGLARGVVRAAFRVANVRVFSRRKRRTSPASYAMRS